jgi:hypothetical protein
MKPSELKKWMAKNDITPVDIAAALKINPRTVERFLMGENVHRSTRAGLTHYVNSHPARPHFVHRKEAVG